MYNIFYTLYNIYTSRRIGKYGTYIFPLGLSGEIFAFIIFLYSMDDGVGQRGLDER